MASELAVPPHVVQSDEPVIGDVDAFCAGLAAGHEAAAWERLHAAVMDRFSEITRDHCRRFGNHRPPDAIAEEDL